MLIDPFVNNVMLLAAGFASGWMLFWGAAAVIPIAIHLLVRRRQSVVPWAAMTLLLNVIEKESKRIRFEQLLLLLLRVAIMVLIALAFARPFLNAPPADGLSAAPEPELWIAVVDTSYSMAYTQDGVSRLQAAKEKTANWLAHARAGDAFAVIGISDPLQPVTGWPSFDLERTVAAIRNLQVRHTAADVSAALSYVQELVNDAAQDPTIPDRAHILVVSDMGADSWQGITPANVPDFEKLVQSSEFVIESVAADEPENGAILALDVNDTRPLVGQSIEVQVRLSHVGNQGGEAVIDLQCLVDGRLQESRRVNLVDSSEETVSMTLPMTSAGYTTITARIGEDGLMADNERTVVVDVQQHERILIVENNPGDARLIELSMRRKTDPLSEANAQDSGRIIRTTNWLRLRRADLDIADLVVLNDISGFDNRFIEILTNFVDRGGRLIVLFGPQTRASDWDVAAGSSTRLIGLQLSEPSDFGNWSIDPLDYESRILRPFRGFPDAGLVTTPLFRYWRTNELDSRTRIDAGVTSGDPLIVSVRRGLGMVVSFLSPPHSGIGSDAQTSWNAMAVWPSFVPIMQQAVKVVLESRSMQLNRICGQVLQGRTGSGRSETIAISTPDGASSQMVSELVGDDYLWFYPNTFKRGVYTVTHSDGVYPFAVNIDPVESALASVPAPLLPDQSLALAPAADPVQNGAPTAKLARILLAAVFVLLCVESWFARFVGNRIR